MVRIYCAALLGVVIFLSYFIGGHVANIKCNEGIANINANQMLSNNNLVEETNDAVFHTSVGDIRRILYEKYTIAE